MNILLIGARGSGKSTVGRRLASRLKRSWIDLDEVVLAEFAQPTVAAVWAECGEQTWRDAEARVLQVLLHQEDAAVIAVGGGVPMIPAAREAIAEAVERKQAVTVYLRASASELQVRLKREVGDRPALKGVNPIDEIPAVLAEREPVYQSLAQVVLETNGLAVDQVVEETVRALP